MCPRDHPTSAKQNVRPVPVSQIAPLLHLVTISVAVLLIPAKLDALHARLHQTAQPARPDITNQGHPRASNAAPAALPALPPVAPPVMLATRSPLRRVHIVTTKALRPQLRPRFR